MNKIIKIKESELLHYVKMEEPNYNGEGNHNVRDLESVCEQYKELVHQLRMKQQNLLKKFNAVIIK